MHVVRRGKEVLHSRRPAEAANGLAASSQCAKRSEQRCRRMVNVHTVISDKVYPSARPVETTTRSGRRCRGWYISVRDNRELVQDLRQTNLDYLSLFLYIAGEYPRSEKKKSSSDLQQGFMCCFFSTTWEFGVCLAESCERGL